MTVQHPVEQVTITRACPDCGGTVLWRGHRTDPGSGTTYEPAAHDCQKEQR